MYWNEVTAHGINAVEKYVNSTDGVQIYATAAGRSSNPALVFIHGIALSALVFAQLFQNKDLLNNFYLVAYDVRGNGRSGKPTTFNDYRSSLQADDFAAVVKGFKLNSPIAVGWSLGGIVAADIFAHLGPNAISGFIYTAPVPWLNVINQVSSPVVGAEIFPQLVFPTDAASHLAARNAFAASWFNHPDKVPSEVFWSWLGSGFLVTIANLQIHTSREQDPAAWVKAGETGFPVLLITGQKDQDIAGASVRQILKNFTGLVDHEVPNGSHALFYEQEAAYVAPVVKFAKRVFANKGRGHD